MKLFLCTVMLLASASSQCGAQFLGASPRDIGQSTSMVNEDTLNALLHSSRPEIQLRTDDTVSVEIYGVKDFSVQQRIAGDGSILFPLIGKVLVAGLSVQQLQETLAVLLQARGMINDPQVTVSATQPWVIVTVSGAVEKPGTFPAFGNLTVMDYLSLAGGLKESIQAGGSSPASSMITLIRTSLKDPVLIPLGSDPGKSLYGRIPLFPGDELRVGRVGVVYAYGALKSQGAFPLKNTSPTTIFQLATLAGGIGFEADLGDAHILRARGNTMEILDVNVAKILNGKAADVVLQSDDILFIPTNKMKAAIKGGAAGLIVSLASTYIYAHP